MSKRSNRDQRMTRTKQKRWKSNLIRGGFFTVSAFVIVSLGWLILRPTVGDSVPLLPSGHVEEGAPLNSRNMEPPTSGDHYNNPLPAKF